MEQPRVSELDSHKDFIDDFNPFEEEGIKAEFEIRKQKSKRDLVLKRMESGDTKGATTTNLSELMLLNAYFSKKEFKNDVPT